MVERNKKIIDKCSYAEFEMDSITYKYDSMIEQIINKKQKIIKKTYSLKHLLFKAVEVHKYIKHMDSYNLLYHLPLIIIFFFSFKKMVTKQIIKNNYKGIHMGKNYKNNKKKQYK